MWIRLYQSTDRLYEAFHTRAERIFRRSGTTLHERCPTGFARISSAGGDSWLSCSIRFFTPCDFFPPLVRRAVVDHAVLLVDLNNKNTDMEQNIDIEFLISLVEMKPVLWGKSLEEYKCRIKGGF